jgi:phenylalanyl-tRNA synthetase beta chain
MFISLNWLQDFLELKLSDKPHLASVVVGHVLSVQKHPNADKLNIAEVEVAPGQINTIVCGANNLAVNQKVPVALPGVTLPGDFQIAVRAVRGIESYGMICAADELGLPNDDNAEGIMVLDNEIPVGTKLSKVLNETNLSPKELCQLFTIRTAEVEGFEIKNNDIVLEIDNKSLTHRPDLWCHYGIARELGAILKLKLNQLNFDHQLTPTINKAPSIEINDNKLAQRFSSIYIEELDNSIDTPELIKQRLLAVGQNPVNFIVDILNYVMLELGQPLHAYDTEKLSGNLTIRRAQAQEMISALNDKTYELTGNEIVITDNNNAQCLAGIIGGNDSAVSPTTHSILLEAATWPAADIRKASTQLGIRTDASMRYEKSLDPNLTIAALNRTITLIKTYQPQIKISEISDNYPEKLISPQIRLSQRQIENYLGQKLNQDLISQILNSLEFQIELEKNENDTIFVVTVPTFRSSKDINNAPDLIEEIIRMYGYENIEANSPHLPIKPVEPNYARAQEHELRELLKSLGYTEVVNYSFYSQQDLAKSNLDETKHLKLKNYLAETQTHLRTSLTPNFLKNINENLKHQTELKIFEIGRTYTEMGEFFPAEETKLILGHSSKSKKTHFYELKSVIENILNTYLDNYSITPTTDPLPYHHPHQTADISTNSHLLGHIFNLHPLIKSNFDLDKAQLSLAEINLGPLLHHKRNTTRFKELDKFPSLTFDIAVLIDEDRTVAETISTIYNSNTELIKDVEIFDIYRGANLEPNIKSLAFKITLAHEDRTLTEDDLKTTQTKVIEALANLGGKLRS